MNCSASSQGDFTYFITDATNLTIPACVVTPTICASTTIGTLISTGAATPTADFAVLTKNGDNTFTIALLSTDPSITGLNYKFLMNFSDSSVSSVTQPTTSSFNILVKCTKTVDCSASSQTDITYFLTEEKKILIPACLIIPSVCKNLTTCNLTAKNVSTKPDFATM